jgi:polyisoprenoid-binding protein YceI
MLRHLSDQEHYMKTAVFIKKSTQITAALLALAAGNSFAADYVIDGTGAGMHSSVNFIASHVGISDLWGRFNDISGTFTYDPANIAASTITVDIDPASLDTNHEARDTHLKSADYLDAAKFPEAGFVSTMIHDLGDGKVHVTGNFTLHGVTKEIAFEATKTGEGETPFGDYRVGWEAETTLNLPDYGVNAGELTLHLAIEGVRQ